jgi:hypothetical protein
MSTIALYYRMETAELFNQSLLLHLITLKLYIHRSDPGRKKYRAELAFLGALTIPRERGIGRTSLKLPNLEEKCIMLLPREGKCLTRK